MIPLPPPVAGVPFDLETAAGRVTGYRLGEGRTVVLLHSFNAAGAGIELAPLASRLAEHRRVVLVDWLGFGTSDRPDALLFGDIRVSPTPRPRKRSSPRTATWNGSRLSTPGISPNSSSRTRPRP